VAVDTPEEAIVSVLKNDANVAGEVVARIFPNEVPQGQSMPAISYEQASGDREHTMAGPIGMVNASYVLSCWSETYSGARTLADYVRIALDGYDSTVGSQELYVIFLESESDNLQRIPDLKVARRYCKQMTFTVWFKEATS
jgi:hypothetical protein